MAVVRDIRKIHKYNNSSSDTVLDYSTTNEVFSIWTYRSGDINREKAAPQNILFPKDQAKILYQALTVFLED